MLAWLGAVTPEVVASGLVGLIMVGVIVRNMLLGWYDARAKMRETERSVGPLTTAVSISWSRDQIERAIQALEHMAELMERQVMYGEQIAKAQGVLSDQFQQSTQARLDELLKKMDKAEREQRPRHR